MEEKRFKEQQAAAEKGWSDDDHGNGKVAHLLDDNFQVTNTNLTHSNKPRAMTFRRHPRPLPCYVPRAYKYCIICGCRYCWRWFQPAKQASF